MEPPGTAASLLVTLREPPALPCGVSAPQAPPAENLQRTDLSLQPPARRAPAPWLPWRQSPPPGRRGLVALGIAEGADWQKERSCPSREPRGGRRTERAGGSLGEAQPRGTWRSASAWSGRASSFPGFAGESCGARFGRARCSWNASSQPAFVVRGATRPSHSTGLAQVLLLDLLFVGNHTRLRPHSNPISLVEFAPIFRLPILVLLPPPVPR